MNEGLVEATRLNKQRASQKFQKLQEQFPKDIFEPYYRSHTEREVCTHFEISTYTMYRLKNTYGIKKTAEDLSGIHKSAAKNIDWEERSRKTEQARVLKYGSHDAYKSSLVEKVKATKISRYGTASYNNMDKNKITRINNNGSLERSYAKGVIKGRLTRIKNSGSLEKSYELQSMKRGATNLSRYGNICSLANMKIQNKAISTFLERYGVSFYCMAPECRAKNCRDSQVNKDFADKLVSQAIEYTSEFPLSRYSFDFHVSSSLIDVNPTITHNSTFHPFSKNEPPKSSTYHLQKAQVAWNNGYQCIHIWDWDDQEKIINLLKPRDRVYARKCVVKEVTAKQCNVFLKDYHLQGTCRGQIVRLGLYYQDVLTGIMTFGKPRYNKGYEWELLRLCYLPGYKIIGGSHKLFSHFIKTCKPKSIISYCDNSKFRGQVYEALGFKSKKSPKPSLHWYNLKTHQHITDNLLRQRGFDQLFGTNYGKGTSNRDLMLGNGFVEIYDVGQSTYTWKIEDGNE